LAQEQFLLPLVKSGFNRAMMRVLVSLSLLFADVHAIGKDLTDASFDKDIDGKNALLFFHAPW